MKRFFPLLLLLATLTGTQSCSPKDKEPANTGTEDRTMVTKRRDDGTVSSVNPVDKDGFVHGVKVNYYEDGVTVHSKITYEHGRKHGPALWYFRNGKVYEHTSFIYGRKNGLTKRYYETGELMEVVTYETGEAVAGAKKYDRQGNLISD